VGFEAWEPALTKVPSVAKAAFGAKSNLAAGCTQNSPGEARWLECSAAMQQRYSSRTSTMFFVICIESAVRPHRPVAAASPGNDGCWSAFA
jgi:hypothetical protein